jgi:hypothetical protein
MQNDAGGHVGLAEDPVTVDQRRGQAVEAMSVRLMASGAQVGIGDLALF